MDSQKSRNVSIAKAFNAAVINQEYATFDEICATNVYIINNFGASLGTEYYQQKLKLWTDSFKNLDYKFTNEIVTDDSAIISITLKTEHIGCFQGIEATGRTVNFDITVQIEFLGGIITKVIASAPPLRPLTEIVGPDVARAHIAIRSPTLNILDGCFSLTVKQLALQGISVTNRQLQCICLWLSGKTSEETANILELSKKTIDYHFDRVKLKFSCHNKQQLFEKIKYLNLIPLLHECFNYLMMNKTQQAASLLK